MTKPKLNLIIDGLLFLCIAAIVGLGQLIKYVLVPGFRRWEIYGRNVELYFWGLDRHQWGTIHLLIGLVFIALLILHIAFHWEMILAMYRKLIPVSLTRRIVAITLVCLTAFLIVFPYFVKPEVTERGRWPGVLPPLHYEAPVSPTQLRQTHTPQAQANMGPECIEQTNQSQS